MKHYLAIDLGAESGRAILGQLSGGVLRTHEVHRFPNEPVPMRGQLLWDLPRLLLEVRRGIRAASEATGGTLHGIAVDSWGVDFGVLDRHGDLVALPVHYRDPRTRGMLDEVLGRVPREEIYDITGIQFLELNTLYQLAALRKTHPGQLDIADRLLLIADLVAYFLSGRAASELTLASTTQLLEARTGRWSHRLLDALDLPERIFGEVVPAGTPLGPLDEDIAREAGLATPPPVIAAASHDTACAVAAVPATDPGGWAFLSSGTWSLLGLELASPLLTARCLEKNFTNEAGVDGTTRFLRNINGLWLVQECRRQWALEGEDIDYARLAELAEEAGPGRATVDPDAPEFFTGGDVPRKIQDACRASGQPVPASKGEIVRCALESLARKYADVARDAAEITGRAIERLHIVGGGSRHALLNRLTASAVGVPVVAGPVEATALGNILVQARATGAVGSLDEIRRIVAQSTTLETVEPE